MVTVAGTHRRRGLLRRMLTESLQMAHDRGDAVAILFAAEWGIYGRFGYAPASFAASYRIDPRLPGASLPTGAVDDGALRQVDPTEIGKYGPEIFDVARRQRAGNIDREPFWWERKLGLNGLAPDKVRGRIPTFVLHTGPDGPDGYVGWAGNGTMDDTGSADIDVIHLYAATPQAYRDLWTYLTNLDLVERIRLDGRPVDELVRWSLDDGRALRLSHQGDGLWLRLLDVPAALSARRYATTGELTLDVVDDDVGGYAAGRFTLRGGPDGAECVVAPSASADLRLGQRALASCYLGGVSLQAQLDAAQVEEITPGARHRADAMFGTAIAPWCATDF
jgi:predicted acetyltransferase